MHKIVISCKPATIYNQQMHTSTILTQGWNNFLNSCAAGLMVCFMGAIYDRDLIFAINANGSWELSNGTSTPITLQNAFSSDFTSIIHVYACIKGTTSIYHCLTRLSLLFQRIRSYSSEKNCIVRSYSITPKWSCWGRSSWLKNE
jgi:hypothetical protein